MTKKSCKELKEDYEDLEYCHNKLTDYYRNAIKWKNIFLILTIMMMVFFMVYSVIITERNKEVKIEKDYHSSGKSFCEHYNGTYSFSFSQMYCKWNINDVIYSCDVESIGEKIYGFESKCPYLEKIKNE